MNFVKIKIFLFIPLPSAHLVVPTAHILTKITFCYISLIFKHYFFTFLAVLAIMTSSSEVRFWQECHSIFVIGSSIIP